MDNSREIEIWKKKLLDLGKRNNLVNYHDNKSSTLEILLPSFEEAYEKLSSSSSVQVFDDKEDIIEDEDLFDEANKNQESKQHYLQRFINKVPSSQILVFNAYKKSKKILKSLMKKASDSITERGVNILYVAFGFVSWRESEESNIFYSAPIIMVPITINNESVTSPYFIQHFDDDITFNMTLQYMLENQYGIQMPEFDDQNLCDFIDELESKVAKLGWSVSREAKISTFSFNKLNMYLDMDKNEDKILSNANVAALTASEESEDIFVTEDELDTISNSRDLFIKQHNVVDADFSQTEAIEYAMMGKSFVLQGPPGTGKSQTITNMIAELIYSGKKVLFVSEKMAALDVVYNNLKKAKLSDFCLQLHSYKANKKDFINDLYDTLNKPKIVLGEEAQENVSKLDSISKRLNNYDSKLYEIHQPINMSLYQLIGWANHFSGTCEVPFIIDNIETLNGNTLAENVNSLKRFSSYEGVIGYNYKHFPLYGLDINDSSYAFKLQLSNLLNSIINTSKDLLNSKNNITNLFNVELDTTLDCNLFLELYDLAKNNKFDDDRLVDEAKLSILLRKIPELETVGRQIAAANNYIFAKYNEAIIEEDYNSIYEDFSTFGNSLFKRLFNPRFKMAKLKLNALLKNGKKIKYTEAIDDLRTLKKRDENLEKFASISQEFTQFNFKLYNGIDTDWDSLLKELTRFKEILFNSELSNKSTFSKIKFDSNTNAVKEFKLHLDELKSNEEKIKPYLDNDVVDIDLSPIDMKLNKFNDYLSNIDSIDIWVEFNHLLAELKDKKLIQFIDLVIENNFKLNAIDDYYKLCFYRQWIDYIFKNDHSLYDYSRFLHENDIKEFGLDDRKQLEISKALINAKLSKERPDPMMQMAGSPASIIRHEHEKKRKQKPIRMIMKEIPSFIQELKPCFLMSPLSVSTFLSDNLEFDVTIFDEASQVFPEDAIVAIYRSKQLIVVGDSKQMPPTKFFMASDSDDEEYDDEKPDIDSYESILDLCSTTFPTKSLLCHYRSRDEGLIAFSNKNFYNYNLVTYPSTYGKKDDLGVDFVYLNNGVIDSRTKVNVIEAEKVVDLIFEHFKTHPERSLGVVAFNIRQQDAILKLLDKRRAQDSSLEEYFKADREEPFFVKNLETVQGDERDTIIFSITYAKNDKGQFALRFGPLSLVGGERRLNVAITRAKLNVKVVSSIHAYDIDISRVSNVGPKLLHDYLDYAEHGSAALDRAINVDLVEDFDSPFEQDVYAFLKDNGFDVTTQVGCSRYRIDLGLKRPGTSDYVLAIECDGATYHSSKSARDRDRLRQSILEGMNWKFYRIWSTDWYKNNSVEKSKLLEACNNALSNNNYQEDSFKNKNKKIDISGLVSSQSVAGSSNIYDSYKRLDAKGYRDAMKLAELYAEYEGPISIDYLLRFVCHLWGYEKVTQAVKNYFKYNFHSKNIIMEDNFLYAPNQKSFAMRKDIGVYLGDINYISDYEIRNGMYAAIEANVQCKKEELFSFVRSQMGFNRAGDKINRKLEKAYELLQPYICIDENDYISINRSKMLKIVHRK